MYCGEHHALGCGRILSGFELAADERRKIAAHGEQVAGDHNGCIAAFALKSQNVCRETAADLFGYSLIILSRKSYGKAGRYVHTDSTGKEPVGG